MSGATLDRRAAGEGSEEAELGLLTPAVFLGLMLAVVAGLCVAIFVDELGVLGVVAAGFFLLLGFGLIVYGLGLTPSEHGRKPRFSEEGFLGLWIAHHLPLRGARAWWVAFGLLWWGLVGLALWHDLPTTSPGTATAPVPQPTPADVPASGSPQKLARDFLVAAYSGNGAAACAELTAQLLKKNGGAQKCASAVLSGARENLSQGGLSPSAAAAQASRGSYSQTIVGGRAGVSIPAPGDPFEGSSLAHLVNQDGTWKIACFGYCGGLRP